MLVVYRKTCWQLDDYIFVEKKLPKFLNFFEDVAIIYRRVS